VARHSQRVPHLTRSRDPVRGGRVAGEGRWRSLREAVGVSITVSFCLAIRTLNNVIVADRA
jgi:hypothetical protein